MSLEDVDKDPPLKVVLFSGAAGAGKDCAISYLENFYELHRRECKDKLHRLTQEMFCVPDEDYWRIYNNRDLKESYQPYFTVTLEAAEELLKVIPIEDSRIYEADGTTKLGLELSIREAMIYVSEVICKPSLGKDYFGEARVASLPEEGIVVDGSCGFREELPPLIDAVGQNNILLIRVHRDGYTFDNDSRVLIPDKVLDNTVDIDNNGSLDSFLFNVKGEVERWLR